MILWILCPTIEVFEFPAAGRDYSLHFTVKEILLKQTKLRDVGRDASASHSSSFSKVCSSGHLQQ